MDWKRVRERDKAVANATPARLARFFRRVAKTRSCWIYCPTGKKGYGLAKFSGEQVSAHRASKIIAQGMPPEESLACHSCNNPSCVNPSHIYWGNYSTNLFDRNTQKDCYRNTRGSRHHSAVLTEVLAAQIWTSYHHEGKRASALAKTHNVKREVVQKLIEGRSWKHVTSALCSPKPLKGPAQGRDTGHSKLTSEDVLEIRKQKQKGASARLLSHQFKVSPNCIRLILTKQRWGHI